MSSEDEREDERRKILAQIMELGKWKGIFQAQGPSPKEDLAEDEAVGTESEEPEAGAEQEQGASASPPVLDARCFLEASCVSSRNLQSAALGGEAIGLQTASELKKVLFGSPAIAFPLAWKKSRFLFREPRSPLGYALITDRAGARGVQMVVQAYIVKHLLFTAHGHDADDVQRLTSVSARDQSRALAEALADALCKSAGGGTTCVCLATPDDYVVGGGGDVVTPDEYCSDKVTETLRIFEFAEREDLLCFLKRHLSCFQDFGSHGAILFLYSALLSHGVGRVLSDCDHTASHLLQLHQGSYECTQALVNLLLTGQASPSVVNGDAGLGWDGEQQHRQGPQSRSEIGFLRWSREDREPETSRQVGSMLKTPRLPVWLCSVNGRLGVLFCGKRSLLSHWRTEHRFSLYYCSGSASQRGTVKLTLNTHSHQWEQGRWQEDGRTERTVPSLERLIHTRWGGTTVDWNGTEPFY
ncbi:inactive ubiquitin carboxyl-terminal hydrolase MINDY-4B-like isoform X2 [Petromyzon marinus]|uniref:Ubiquitin carboxyl-terminal hydrolase MINDY n=1 Tax=Petromyzon marinus TaxID=7757 RepID=A0AAJ7XAM4_PETMA|nr:inactive ubiquitin carboxyl-terminal hydrolase MINDY-4B-like isoform X2 [Petromyzon marinus]